MTRSGGCSPRQEVSEVVEVAMRLVLNVDNTPSVLAAAYRLTVDHHVPLGADNGEWHHALQDVRVPPR